MPIYQVVTSSDGTLGHSHFSSLLYFLKKCGTQSILIINQKTTGTLHYAWYKSTPFSVTSASVCSAGGGEPANSFNSHSKYLLNSCKPGPGKVFPIPQLFAGSLKGLNAAEGASWGWAKPTLHKISGHWAPWDWFSRSGKQALEEQVSNRM